MGIGTQTASHTVDDIMESSIVENPHNNAQRFRNRVFEHVVKNRDAFGYPKGCNEGPYMFCSNDLSGIFFELVKMTQKHRDDPGIKEIGKDLLGILDLLISSYDDVADNCSGGCCRYWHSVDKEVIVTLANTLEAELCKHGTVCNVPNETPDKVI